MIIIVNGAFGVGKTTVANQLLKVVKNAMVFDPEEVGFMLRNMLPQHIQKAEAKTGNFQDFELWRELTVQVARTFIRKYNKHLIVPMTIYNPQYFEYIKKGFTQIDQDTVHFCLIASKNTIHNRLRGRGEQDGDWAFQQTDTCLTAFCEYDFSEYINTEQVSVDQVVRLITTSLERTKKESFQSEKIISEVGNILIVREAEVSDAANLLTLIREVEASSEYMLWEREERELDSKQQAKIIERMKQAPNSTILVAENAQKELVGYCFAIGGNANRNRHSAYLVAGILESCRGQGIGTNLFVNLEQWAMQHSIHRLELTVVTENDAGIALYKKMGFEIEGTKWHSLLINGQFMDEYYMSKILEPVRPKD